MTGAPIITISGYPGGGKTTLANALRDRLGVPALHYDDYETMTGMAPAAVRDWIGRGSDYDEIELGGLIRDMRRLAVAEPRPKCVVLDTLLGRAHRATGELIHTSIWIDTPPDIALARRIREAAGRARAAPGEAEAFTGWLESYLAHYADFTADTYVVQQQRVRPMADIVLDGRLAPERLAEQAASAILARIEGGGNNEPD